MLTIYNIKIKSDEDIKKEIQPDFVIRTTTPELYIEVISAGTGNTTNEKYYRFIKKVRKYFESKKVNTKILDNILILDNKKSIDDKQDQYSIVFYRELLENIITKIGIVFSNAVQLSILLSIIKDQGIKCLLDFTRDFTRENKIDLEIHKDYEEYYKRLLDEKCEEISLLRAVSLYKRKLNFFYEEEYRKIDSNDKRIELYNQFISIDFMILLHDKLNKIDVSIKVKNYFGEDEAENNEYLTQ